MIVPRHAHGLFGDVGAVVAMVGSAVVNSWLTEKVVLSGFTMFTTLTGVIYLSYRTWVTSRMDMKTVAIEDLRCEIADERLEAAQRESRIQALEDELRNSQNIINKYIVNMSTELLKVAERSQCGTCGKFVLSAVPERDPAAVSVHDATPGTP